VTTFAFVITVECETLAQAHQVIAERIGCDEDYGFDYTIDCPTVLGAAAPDDDDEWDDEAVANEAWSHTGFDGDLH
jgi:hypothetical protein